MSFNGVFLLVTESTTPDLLVEQYYADLENQRNRKG